MDTTILIDRLVLDGIEVRDEDAFRRGFEAETARLSRLRAIRPVRGDRDGTLTLDLSRAVGRERDSRAIGVAVARALFGDGGS